MTARARQNEEVARRFWRGLADGDPAPVLEFDADVVWRVYGTGPIAGEYHGVDGALKLLGTLGERAEDLRIDVTDVFASDAAALVKQQVTFRRGSKTLEGEYFTWLRVEDGTVTELATVPFDQAAVDAFWKPH